MTLVKEYIDRYRGDEMEDIFKLLERRLLQVIADYAKRKASDEKDKSWLQPDKWMQNILNDQGLGDETKDFWVQALLNHGYYNKNLVKERLDFERGLDPKKVLNLGIKEQILKYAQLKCQLGDWSWSSPSGWLWEIQEDKDIPIKTKMAWFDYLQSNPDYLKISMDEHGNVSEAQEFQRGLTPKQSMGIGLEEQIRNFLDEKTSSSPSLWISYLLSEGTDEELDRETRKKWIKFLLTKPMYVADLGEEEYYNLKEWGIEWIPYVPLANKDFKYKKLGTKYILDFHGWEDFSPCFDYDRELSEEFVQAVLSGDAFDQFQYDSGFEDITDLSWPLNRELKKGKKIPALKDIKRIAITLGGNPENMEDLDQLLDEISTNEDLSELKEAISFAFEESQQSADEHEAYTKLKEAIQKHFEIEEGKWIGEGEKAYYRAPISFDGLHHLAYCLATNEEQIKYSHPYGGYSGDISAETFNDAIYNKLEDLE